MTAPTGATIDQRSGAESAALAEAALDRKVEQLERGLDELRDQLDREHDALVHAQAQLTRAENAPAVVAPPQAHSGRGIGASIAALLALGASAFGIHAWRDVERLPRNTRSFKWPRKAPCPRRLRPARRSRGTARSPDPTAGYSARNAPCAARTPLQEEDGERQWSPTHWDADATHRDRADRGGQAQGGRRCRVIGSFVSVAGQHDGLEDTVNLGDTHLTAGPSATVSFALMIPAPRRCRSKRRASSGSRIDHAGAWRRRGYPACHKGIRRYDPTRLQLARSDATVQHVQMPSALHENVGFKERRTSLVDS